MNKKIMMHVFLGVVLGLPTTALCKSACSIKQCDSGTTNEYMNNMVPPNATEYAPVCYTSTELPTGIGGKETKCKPGFTIVCGKESSYYVTLNTSCSNADALAGNFCSCNRVCTSASCSDCSSEDWDITYGHIYMTAKCEFVGDAIMGGTCECKRTFDTRCFSQTYGQKIDTTVGRCTLCPTIDGENIGYTNLDRTWGIPGKGAADITGCYAPAGDKYIDQYGTYEYTNDCYYKN